MAKPKKRAWWHPNRPLTEKEKQASGSFADDRRKVTESKESDDER